MSATSVTSPPFFDEVEVSLFGPGYGESAVVHLGDSEWLVVDSCVDLVSRRPVALLYLSSLGVNPASAVRVVVATHWHDDHVRGLGQLYEKCKSAKFVCSSALRSEEFLRLVNAVSTRSMMSSSGVDELRRVLETLGDRKAPPAWAVADRPLFRRGAASSVPCEIHALSPSDAAILLGLRDIARLVPTAGEPKRRLVVQRPNHMAVALWVRIGSTAILLGADLEATKEPKTGWSAIVDSQTKPDSKAEVFKIPHHGSRDADFPRVWSEMLDENPLAIVTPFLNGNVSLPTSADIERICQRTSEAYSTGPIGAGRVRRRSSTVERTIREAVLNIRALPATPGQIRLRRHAFADPGAPWKIDLLNGAVRLSTARAA